MSVTINCKHTISGSLVLIAFIGCVLGAGQVDMDPNVSEEHLDILRDRVEGISDLVDPDADLDQRRRAVERLKGYVLDDIKRRDWELNRRTLFSGEDGWRRLGSYRVETVAAIRILRVLATKNAADEELKKESKKALFEIEEGVASLSKQLIDRVAPMTEKEARKRIAKRLDLLKQHLKSIEDNDNVEHIRGQDEFMTLLGGYVMIGGRYARVYLNYETNGVAYLRSRILHAYARGDCVVDAFERGVRDIGRAYPDAEGVALPASLLVGNGGGLETFVTGDARFVREDGDDGRRGGDPEKILILFSKRPFGREHAFDDVRGALNQLQKDERYEELATVVQDSMKRMTEKLSDSLRIGVTLSGDVIRMSWKEFLENIEATNRARSQWGLPEITREELGEAHEILQDLPEVNENEEEDRTPSILQLRPVEED